jgi:toxin-antitoxin system PIN domain toxin
MPPMLAVDVNVLLHATRSEMALHTRARRRLVDLAEGPAPWGLPAPVVWGFLRIVTQPVFDPPTSMPQAVATIDALLASPTVRLLRPGPRHWTLLTQIIDQAAVTGRLMTDAALVAICLESGVDAMLSTDRDFARFDQITWQPLTSAG